MSWSSNIVGRAIYYQLKNLCAGRVYPVVGAQETTTPYIIYSVLSSTPDYTKDSKSVADKLRVQVDIFDKTFDAANVTASLVRDQLDFLVGTIAGVPVDSVRYEDESTMYEPEVRLHRISQDYFVRIPNDSTPRADMATQTIASVTGDYTATDIIPPGYTVTAIIVENSTANTGQISAGTSAGGNDVFASEAIKKSGFTTIPCRVTYSSTLFTSIYFNHAGDGDTWAGMTCNIYVLLTKYK